MIGLKMNALSLEPSVLYAGTADVVFINKPAGWLSIPAPKAGSDVPVLSHWIKENLSFEPRIVHRLDRFTSGVMMVAKTEEAQRMATRWFENREVKKEYWFLAGPTPNKPAIQVSKPIQGKSAVTLFEIIQSNPSRTVFLGRATPLTGRFHQIRDHAEHGGFPLFGDTGQGGPNELFGRFALHARLLRGPNFEVTAPLPQDFQNWLRHFNFEVSE